MTKIEATWKVQNFRTRMTDEELCKKIGISKPTLYTRLNKHNRKLGEIALIEKL